MELKGCVGWRDGNIWRGVICSSISPQPTVLGKYVLDEIQVVGTERFLKNLKMLSSFDDYIAGERCKFCGLRGVGPVVDTHPAILNNEFAGDAEYPDVELNYHTHFIEAGKQICQYNSDPYNVLWVYIVNPEEVNVDVFKSFKDGEYITIDYGIGKYAHEYIGTIDFQTNLADFSTSLKNIRVNCAKYLFENGIPFESKVCDYCNEDNCDFIANAEVLREIMKKYEISEY